MINGMEWMNNEWNEWIEWMKMINEWWNNDWMNE